MGKKAASKEKVEELHDLIAQVFKAELDCMISGASPADHKLLGVITKFINDNGVQAWEDMQELESTIAQIAQRKTAQRESMPDNLVELKQRLAARG